MGLKDIISGLNTLGKAVKFLKQQDDLKEQAKTLIEEVRNVINVFEKYVLNLKDVLEKLKELLNK